jgi:hypothetical protein
VSGDCVGTKTFKESAQIFGTVEGAISPGFAAVPANALVVWGKPGQSGTATITALGIINGSPDVIATQSVTVGGGSAPVVPPVDPPTPADPLLPTLQAAFKADGSPSAAASKLASLYASANTIVDNSSNTTLDDVFIVLSISANNLCPLPTLMETRKAIAAELNSKIGTNRSQGLDTATKATLKAQFARMATLLGALK